MWELIVHSFKQFYVNLGLDELGYPAQPKVADVESSWPYEPGTTIYLDSALYTPGPESERQAERFKVASGIST